MESTIIFLNNILQSYFIILTKIFRISQDSKLIYKYIIINLSRNYKVFGNKCLCRIIIITIIIICTLRSIEIFLIEI